MKKIFKFAIIASIVLILDQLFKYLITNQILPIPYSINTGAVFGILHGLTDVLIWISIIVLVAILYYHDEIAKQEKYLHYSVSLIFGGALGNLIYRIRLGQVVDFINLKIWPSFNIADAAITIGAIGLLVYMFKKDR